MPDAFHDPLVRRLLTELADAAKTINRAAAPPVPPKPTVFQRVAEVLEQARKITFSLAVIMVGGILIAITAKAAFEPVSVFEPIEVSASLSEFSGKILTERMIAQMHAIRRHVFSAKNHPGTKSERIEPGEVLYLTTPRFQALSAVTIPGSGLNMQSVVKLIQDLVNTDNIRVSGVLTAKPAQASALYTLELSYDHSGLRKTKRIQHADPEELVNAAAESVLEFSDPSLLIEYYCQHGKWTHLDASMDHFVRTEPEAANRETAVQLMITCGNGLYNHRHYDQAIEGYTRALKLKPDYAIALNNRGNAYRQKKAYGLALKDLDRAIKLNPNYALAVRNRAYAYMHMKEYARAIADFDRALALQPGEAVAYNNRCWTRAMVGDLQLALSDCNESLRLRAENPAAFDSRALVHLKLGDLDAALADFDAALQLDPQHVTALYGRGVAKRRKGDVAAGNDDIAAAKAIRSDIADEYTSYGITAD